MSISSGESCLKSMKFLLLFVAMLIFAPLASAQIGEVDRSFGDCGAALADFSSESQADYGYRMAVYPNTAGAHAGKVVVVGSTRVGPSNDAFSIARFNADGSPDLTFSGDRKANG